MDRGVWTYGVVLLTRLRRWMRMHLEGSRGRCDALPSPPSLHTPLPHFCPQAGLDDAGAGAVYGYDSIGSYERSGYGCQGSGKDLVQPLLDNQLMAASPLVLPARPSTTSLSLEQATDLVKTALAAAAERDIYTGDGVEILKITRGGVERELMPLRQD